MAARNMREPQRSLMKPELVWQYEKGLQLSNDEVSLYMASCFLRSHATSAKHVETCHQAMETSLQSVISTLLAG